LQRLLVVDKRKNDYHPHYIVFHGSGFAEYYYFIVGVVYLAAEEDPFADVTEKPRPEREILKIPQSISYTVDGGSNVYTITGIYVSSQKNDLNEFEILFETIVPDCQDCNIDLKKRTYTLRTKRKLTHSELAYAIDDMAEMGGEVPYWVELEARDLEKAKDSQLDFMIQEFKGEKPKNIALFSMFDGKPFEIPFCSLPMQGYKILITPTTAFCICHSRSVYAF